ncbi:PUA domain-containing protein [Sulfurisphaera javensis]
MKAQREDLEYLRNIATYQFSYEISSCLFPQDSSFLIQKSLTTNRIRFILTEDKKLYLVLRAQDNLFSLTELSGAVIKSCSTPPTFRFVIRNDVANFIREGRNVFCKFVVNADKNIRAGDEVLIVDENDNLLGVGRAKVSGEEVKQYKRGLAVIVKRGIKNVDQDSFEGN